MSSKTTWISYCLYYLTTLPVSKGSPESKALQRSYESFMNGVDPANVVGPLFTAELLTPQERQKATQRISTPTEQLREIFDALERRVSTKPAHFHTLVEILRSYHNDVAEKMQR